MPKMWLRTLLFLAESTNFSEMGYPDRKEFDQHDEGEQEDKMYGQIQADRYLLLLLRGFNDRQKIILMYQLLREAGYNLNHEDCAHTIGLTRGRYMGLLKEVKKRAAKILQIPME